MGVAPSMAGNSNDCNAPFNFECDYYQGPDYFYFCRFRHLDDIHRPPPPTPCLNPPAPPFRQGAPRSTSGANSNPTPVPRHLFNFILSVSFHFVSKYIYIFIYIFFCC